MRESQHLLDCYHELRDIVVESLDDSSVNLCDYRRDLESVIDRIRGYESLGAKIAAAADSAKDPSPVAVEPKHRSMEPPIVGFLVTDERMLRSTQLALDAVSGVAGEDKREEPDGNPHRPLRARRAHRGDGQPSPHGEAPLSAAKSRACNAVIDERERRDGNG